jgi:rubredoxin
MKWTCAVCGYSYDEDEGDIENGIEPGLIFEELGEEFVCPICGALKEDFEAIDE